MWIFVVVAWLSFGLAGAVAGERQGRAGAGFALGFFFGPWGMVAAMMLAPSARVAYEAACDRVALEDRISTLGNESAACFLAVRQRRTRAALATS